jgi:hypothetical protein
MLNYSELSAPQKRIIDLMRQGKELRFVPSGDGYTIYEDYYNTIKVNQRTCSSLLLRGFIKPCYRNEAITVYCVNIEISGLPPQSEIDRITQDEKNI